MVGYSSSPTREEKRRTPSLGAMRKPAKMTDAKDANDASAFAPPASRSSAAESDSRDDVDRESVTSSLRDGDECMASENAEPDEPVEAFSGVMYAK